jgi:hypothetical protein
LVVVAEAAGITTAHLHAATTSTVAVLALALSLGSLSGTGSSLANLVDGLGTLVGLLGVPARRTEINDILESELIYEGSIAEKCTYQQHES